MAKSISKIDKQCVYWLPCMAQDNINVLHEGSLYMQYETQGKAMFYQVHSHVTKPHFHMHSSQPRDFRGLTIKVRITGYRDRNYYNGFDQSLFSSPGNAIEEITQHKFEYFADEIFPEKLNNILKKEHKKNIKEKENVIKNHHELILILTLTDYLPSGLSLFSIEVEKDAPFYEKIKDILYYQVKLHFHQHHFHDKMDKTAKAIYISQQDESIDIQVDDNRGLLHYIEKFHEIITKEIDTLYQDYKIIDTPNRHKKKDENISKKEAKKRILKFYDNCYNLIGLGVFVQSLLNCIQNKVCRLDNSGSQLPEHAKKKYQSYASNMVNAKAGVEALRSKIKHHHDDENLRKANNISHISLFLGIISIVLAFSVLKQSGLPCIK